ncbi:hypothetical protein [Shumkonia mesophila]|uniref:hypothetical protein n=1 Tax=Shumkonia mesophila TaxID=2838854 RepID=UPI002934B337|nr:hypothetical protein [Shumkonia mesophila]
MTFALRGLELHGRRMWERECILEALGFIERHGMNALILHETDLLHEVLFPRAYFDPYAQWKSAPTRRGENAIQNNRVYLDHVLKLAGSRHIAVWLEIKELGFPDEVVEMRPDLIKDGHICPSDPFWGEFIGTLTDELFTDFPDIAGLIVSAGSPEGRASRAQNKCHCALCERTSLEDWYHQLIMAMWRPVGRHGKRLAIRDFAYKPADHEPLIAAVGKAPRDIIFSIKATPHDFYPTFPDNPAFGRLDREQWVEYDVMGQFYGLGVVPCFVYDDLRRRLDHARSKGATGAVFRAEWERVNDWWCLGTLNEVNLIAAALMARGEAVDTNEVCRRWLDDHGWARGCAGWLSTILREAWPIVRRALYIQDFMFADSSFFPRSIGRAWWTMETKHSLSAWDPSRADDLRLSPERLHAMLAEKAEAVARVHAYAERVRVGDPSVPPDFHEQLVAQADLFVTYVEGFEKCARVCLLARTSTNGRGERLHALKEAITDLESYGQRIRPLSEEARHPHQVVLLLDHRRVADIAREGRACLEPAK